ncbi:MAG: hypothetical protein ACRBEQ_01465 [Hyphomonas sp.]
MNSAVIKYGLIGLAVAGFFGYQAINKAANPQTADLGQVLDRTEFAIETYEEHAKSNASSTTLSDSQVEEFGMFLAEVMNTEPRFYDDQLGMKVQEDALFLGFKDSNANGIQDSGEKKVFSVEIDAENQRLIATDETGESVGHRFSGTGILTGYLIGSMLGRQRAAGITPNSFNNRNVTSRSNYKPSARTRTRTGGSRSGK